MGTLRGEPVFLDKSRLWDDVISRMTHVQNVTSSRVLDFFEHPPDPNIPISLWDNQKLGDIPSIMLEFHYLYQMV